DLLVVFGPKPQAEADLCRSHDAILLRKEYGRRRLLGAPASSTDLARPAPGGHFGGFCCNTLHSTAVPTDTQPLPLQALWPLQAFTPLQSLLIIPEPLGLLMVCALAANVLAANRAAALAMMIFFCIIIVSLW